MCDSKKASQAQRLVTGLFFGGRLARNAATTLQPPCSGSNRCTSSSSPAGSPACFYLPRIFVNLAMVAPESVGRAQTGWCLMARKLLRFHHSAGGACAGASGLWLWLGYGIGRGPGNGWMHAKLARGAGSCHRLSPRLRGAVAQASSPAPSRRSHVGTAGSTRRRCCCCWLPWCWSWSSPSERTWATMHKNRRPGRWRSCLLRRWSSTPASIRFPSWRDQGIAPWAFLASAAAQVLDRLRRHGQRGGLHAAGLSGGHCVECHAPGRRHRASVRAGIAATVAAWAAMSLAMETLQSYLPVRVPSNVDWVLNIGGRLAGRCWRPGAGAPGCVGPLAAGLRERWFVEDARGALVLLALWPLALLFPAAVAFRVSGRCFERLETGAGRLAGRTPLSSNGCRCARVETAAAGARGRAAVRRCSARWCPACWRFSCVTRSDRGAAILLVDAGGAGGGCGLGLVGGPELWVPRTPGPGSVPRARGSGWPACSWRCWLLPRAAPALLRRCAAAGRAGAAPEPAEPGARPVRISRRRCRPGSRGASSASTGWRNGSGWLWPYATTGLRAAAPVAPRALKSAVSLE